jgi:hypothetical protein
MECMCRPPTTLAATPSYPDLQVTSEMHLLNVLRPHTRSNGHFSPRHGTGCPLSVRRGRGFVRGTTAEADGEDSDSYWWW